MMQALKIGLSSLSGIILSSGICATTAPAVMAQSPSLKGYVYPIVAPKISSRFGSRRHPIWKVKRHHDGLDLAVPIDTPIRAVADGVVVFSDPYKGYGNLIVLRHSDNITTHYGHCHTILVKPGERVSAGQIIGTVGKTGLATGTHLHFEIRQDGNALDPLKILPGIAEQAQG